MRDVIVLEGINDLGLPPWADFDRLVAGFSDLIARSRAAGIRVHLGTILLASNSIADGMTSPLSSDTRLRVNDWIRTRSGADSVVDFDARLRGRANLNVLEARYAGSTVCTLAPPGTNRWPTWSTCRYSV